MSAPRTYCGTPRAGDAGTRATAYGWVDRRRDHGGLIFIDLRDYTGILQVVIDPNDAPEAHRAAREARLEWVLRFEGELRLRAPENVNPKRETGEVELRASACTVLAVAKTPPFPVNEDTEVDEQLRLRHRYLDLRRVHLQHNLRARAKFSTELRRAMGEIGFLEIETPMMIRATPEGARDYLVPSRLFPGSFYALPQSPQLYKQLSMVAGFDRYFQLAHCMRDEDLRADRQPEFTQLDIEMSFVDEDDVFAALEHAIPSAWEACEFRGGHLPVPFPRMTWRHAMDCYGVDKPDTRFEMLLRDLTDIARTSGFRVFAEAVTAGGIVKGICVKGGDDLTRGDIESQLTEVARGAKATRARVSLEACRRLAGRDREVLHTRRTGGDRRRDRSGGRGLRAHGCGPAQRRPRRARRLAQPPRTRPRSLRRPAHRHALGDRVPDVRAQRRDRGDQRCASPVHDDPR